jgi:hypothetical protein
MNLILLVKANIELSSLSKKVETNTVTLPVLNCELV